MKYFPLWLCNVNFCTWWNLGNSVQGQSWFICPKYSFSKFHTMKFSASNCTQQYFNLSLCYLLTKHCPFVIKTSFGIPRDTCLNFAISHSAVFLHCWIFVLAPSRICAHVMSKFMFEWAEKEPCFTEWLQDSTREVVIASMQFLRNIQKWLPSFASLLRRFSCNSTTAWQHD